MSSYCECRANSERRKWKEGGKPGKGMTEWKMEVSKLSSSLAAGAGPALIGSADMPCPWGSHWPEWATRGLSQTLLCLLPLLQNDCPQILSSVLLPWSLSFLDHLSQSLLPNHSHCREAGVWGNQKDTNYFAPLISWSFPLPTWVWTK